MSNLTMLGQYTSPDLIVPELRGGTGPAAIEELCCRLHTAGRLNDRLSFYNAVTSHELQSSTAMSPGWALPHARVQGLPQLSLAMGRSRMPFDWFEHAGDRVRMVFLFAVPETEAATYMALISAVARLSQDATRLECLHRVADGEAMFEILNQIPLYKSQTSAAGS